MNPFDLAAVLADARRKESLTDWGPGDFETPLEVLLADYAEADLNAIGVLILRAGLVHSLRMRLRAQEWIRRHPEILEERIAAPIVVVGMMRSGTTLLQRLLAADPRFHCAYGWEVVEAAPRLDYQFAGVDPRIAVSEVREAKSRELAPDLFVIHPMYAREAEEEIVFLADAFLSHVPGVRRTPSALPIVARRAGFHARIRLSAPDAAVLAVAETASGARSELVAEALGAQVAGSSRLSGRAAGRSSTTCTSCTCTATRAPRSRRGPASTRPCTRCTPTPWTGAGSARSGCSEWAGPMTARWRCGTVGSPKRKRGTRVTDIGFDDAVDDPIGQVARVYDAVDMPLTIEAETAMRRWLKERPREAARPPYALEDYGLRPEQVDERFTLYNKRFEQYVGK